MSKQNSGQEIADKIRKTLLRIDFRLVYAQGQASIANEDFKLHSKLGDKRNLQKAMKDKARLECYKVYCDNLNKIKNDVMTSLDNVLDKYSPKYKTVWYMYFISQCEIKEICKAVSYTSRNVDRIVLKLKQDLGTCLGENQND